MKKALISVVVGLIGLSSSLLANNGTYTQNFDAHGNSISFGDGSIVRAGNAATTVGGWAGGNNALRLTGDTITNQNASYFLPSLAPAGKIESFSASFKLLFKSDIVPADAFSFNFGTFKTTASSYGNDQGMYDPSGVKTGSMLSVVWDTYSNGGSDPRSIELLLNGVRLGNNTTVVPFTPNTFSVDNYRDVTINWANNLVNVTYGGATVFSNVSTGSFVPNIGDSFAFNAQTGGSSQDTFIDNVSVTAIPEPSTFAAIAGAAMLGMAVCQRRRRAA
jgi:hypothetical protein